MGDSQKDQLVIAPLPGFQVEIGRAVWMLEDARMRTRRALKGMNPDHVDYQATPDGHSISTLMYHIAVIELDWLYAEVLITKWSDETAALFPHDVRDKAGRLTHIADYTQDELWGRLDHVRALLLDTFKGMTVDDFRRKRELPDYDVTPEWVLHHLCQHEAEHRDELIALRQGAERGN